MNEIPIGAERTDHLLVTPEVAIEFLGSEEALVLSTPHMVEHMEITSRNLLLTYLGENEDSVGTTVNIRHLAATPVGISVTFHSKVIGVQGRRVTFQVEAKDEFEVVGDGTHERFVVNIPRFVSSLAAKRVRT